MCFHRQSFGHYSSRFTDFHRFLPRVLNSGHNRPEVENLLSGIMVLTVVVNSYTREKKSHWLPDFIAQHRGFFFFIKLLNFILPLSKHRTIQEVRACDTIRACAPPSKKKNFSLARTSSPGSFYYPQWPVSPTV